VAKPLAEMGDAMGGAPPIGSTGGAANR